MRKHKDYRLRAIEILQQLPKRTFADGYEQYLVSGSWSSELRGMVRRLLCETFTIVEPVGLRVSALPSDLRQKVVGWCEQAGINYPLNRTLYTLNGDRFDQVLRDLLMQRTPIVIIRAKKRSDDRLGSPLQQPLSVFTWPADPS